MILSDYRCFAHGIFEGWEAKCPHGCSGEFVEKVFLKPVGMMSDKTRHNDSTMKSLASDYGMTDIKSTREGEAQPSRFNQQKNPYAVQWADPKSIGSYNTTPIAGETTNGLQLGKETGLINPLRPNSVIKDHENLQIEK
jgi:hypothetical protein